MFACEAHRTLAAPIGPWCVTFAPTGLKNLRHCPHKCIFVLIEMRTFCPSVHTYTLNIVENSPIWKCSWNWIKTKTHTCHVSVDVQKRCVYGRHLYVVQLALHHAILIVSKHFSVDIQKCIKTETWTWIHQCVFNENENAYFWIPISVDRMLDFL